MFVAVIECKRATDPLADHVTDQGFRYANDTDSPFVATTNGDDLYTWQWEPMKRRYVPKRSFPTYRQVLLGESLTDEVQPKPFVRPSWRQLNDPAWLQRQLHAYKQQFVCDKADGWIKKHAFDLWSLFRSSAAVRGLPWAGHGVRILEDWGAGFKEFGNSSGGSYPGFYRTFLVDEGPRTSLRSVSFGLFSVEGSGRNKAEAVRTSLVIAVSNEERRHNSLQLWVERWWQQREGSVEMLHDGRLAFGRGGAVARETVLRRVIKEAPSLMKNGQVFLGRFSVSRQIEWKDAREIVLRLSRYAILRDRVRDAERR